MPIGALAMAGLQTAQQVASAGMGLLFAGANDRRQIKQQQKLTDMQLEADKKITQFQAEKQLEMWKNTSYGPQKEQMKAAGLNPALMYGMSGGGGQSTGAGAASTHGASAPVGGGEAMGMLGMGMQLQLLKAQKENIEADTEKKRAEIPQIGASTDLTNKNIEIAELERQFKDKTLQEAINTIGIQMLLLDEQRKGQVRENFKGDILQETDIAYRKQELIGLAVEQTLKKEQTNLAKSTQKVNEKEIWQITQAVEQGWKKLTIDEQNALTNSKQAENSENFNKAYAKLIDNIVKNEDTKESTKMWVQTGQNVLKSIFERIGKAAPTPGANLKTKPF